MSTAGNDNPAGSASPTTAANGQRAAQSRASAAEAAPLVLVVDDALAERLSDGLVEYCLPGAQLQAVPTFLHALGELGRSKSKPAAMLVPIRALSGMVAVGAEALRRMVPDARLMVVADAASHAEAERAMEHGFDALVPEPVERHALHAAWHGRPSPAAEPQAGANSAADPQPAPAVPGASGAATGPAPASPPADREAPTRAGNGDVTDDLTRASGDLTGASVMAHRPVMPASAEPAGDAEFPDAPADDAELGDVDLVEAILNGRGLLRRTAMRLLAARSGIEQVAWAGPQQDVPPEHVTAVVACRHHLFGTLHAPSPARQDHMDAWAGWLSRWLTLERQVHQLEELSMKDELTRVWNRRYFNRFLKHVLERAARDRSQVTLLVFDIDDFKSYNDTYGHPAGDDILRETARLIQSSVREHDVVARIGGDEFAAIFWDAEEKRRSDSQHPESVRTATRRFQHAIAQHRFPKLVDQAADSLTISGGLASFPWDGRTPEELLEKADQMAMQSKRQGKNAITFGPGALRQ